MPSLASVTLNDGATTPVAHIFEPVTTDGSLATLSERVGVPSGYKGLQTHVRPPVQGNGTYKVRVVITDPVMVTNSGGVQVVDFAQVCRIEFTMSERSSEQNRKDILAYAKNMLSHALATDLVVKLSPQY